MRKQIIFFVAALIGISTVSCGSTDSKYDADTEKTATETQPVETTEPVAAETTENLQEKDEDEEKLNWYLEPTIEADDINVIPQGDVSALKDEERYHGYFAETNMSVITKADKCGLIDNSGKELIKPEFDDVHVKFQEYGGTGEIMHIDFGTSLYCVETSKIANINIDSVFCCSACRNRPFGTTTNYFEYAYDPEYMQMIRNGGFGDGKIMMSGQNSGFGTGSLHDETCAYTVYNVKLNSPYRAGDYENYATLENPKFGVVKNNEIIIDFIYDDATGFGKDGVAAFLKNGKWGYINSDGKEVIPFESDAQFEDKMPNFINRNEKHMYPYNPTEGLIALNKGNEAGYYDIRGNEIIPVGTFEKARPVYDGLAWVKYNGKWGVIKLNENDERTAQDVQSTDDNNESDMIYGIVTTESGVLNVRSTPEIISGNIISSFNKGTRINIDLGQSNDGWYYANGISSKGNEVSGFVSKDYVTLTDSTDNSDTADDNESSTGESDWKQLYVSKLNEYMNSSDAMFDLVDMNGDSIPELLVSDGTIHLSRVTIYSIFENSLTELGSYGEYGIVLYNPTIGRIRSRWMNQGIIDSVYYKVEKNEIVKIYSSSTNAGAVASKDEMYFEINGENVTPEEYEKIESENPVDGWDGYGRKYEITADVISRILN